jgi:hypothetical protein
MNTLVAIQIVALAVSLISLCIGTFSNHWIKSTISNVHAGLYVYCVESNCVLGAEQRSLTLIVIGLVFLAHGLIIALIIFLKESSFVNQVKQLSLASLAYSLVSFILLIAGWSLYVDHYNKKSEISQLRFDWSLYLVLAAISACFVSIIISIINILKRRND